PGEELPGEELSGESPASKVTARAGNRKISASEQLWDNEKIRAILTRYAYTGADVHHPYSQSGGRISGDFGRSESEAGRKVIENAHDAIVTKAQYEKAQSQRQRRRGCRKRSSAQYAFKGKVRCGVCRLAMSRIHQAGGDAFYCSHRKYIGTHSACCSEYIPVTLIEQAARQQLREWQQEQDQPFDEMIEPYIETVYIYSADRIEVIFKPH
ncbi:MAG: recombinase family protein, partial [Lachnospiraceae bacterium]|nr:recombinase family protein [Lachnospiraceae bacterium]